MNGTCPCEDAVLAAALAGSLGDDSVQSHLSTCESCRDIHLLVTTLHEDRAEALTRAVGQMPSAGLVWWKAVLRARHEDAARATGPITVVAALTAACVLGGLASVAGLAAWWLQDAALVGAIGEGWAAALAAATPPSSLATVTATQAVVWLVAAALAIATPVALYVALREE